MIVESLSFAWLQLQHDPALATFSTGAHRQVPDVPYNHNPDGPLPAFCGFRCVAPVDELCRPKVASMGDGHAAHQRIVSSHVADSEINVSNQQNRGRGVGIALDRSSTEVYYHQLLAS